MITACASVGSSTFTTWKRRARAASFSKYFLYSDQVVAAMVRSSPRASAGLSRFAASPCPACPPAPIIVCASSMNRMIGWGEALTSSMTDFKRFSNSPLHPSACLQQPEIERAQRDILQGRRHVARGDAQRKTFNDRGLADARLAGEDRVVLAPPGENIDQLSDLEVAAEHRIDLPLPRPCRSDRW